MFGKLPERLFQMAGTLLILPLLFGIGSLLQLLRCFLSGVAQLLLFQLLRLLLKLLSGAPGFVDGALLLLALLLILRFLLILLLGGGGLILCFLLLFQKFFDFFLQLLKGFALPEKGGEIFAQDLFRKGTP